MKKGDCEQKGGFTIIEASLTLAIAGLIFLMMFVVLPSLNRSQRDARRRDDVVSLLNNVKKYQQNHRGALPGSSQTGSVDILVGINSTGDDTTWAGFYKEYLGDNFVDPDGSNYNLRIRKCAPSSNGSECSSNANIAEDTPFPNNYEMTVVLQGECNGNRTIPSSNPRKLAVIYRLEGAGVYCDDI